MSEKWLCLSICAIAGMHTSVASVRAADTNSKATPATLELIRYQAERAKKHAAEAGTAASNAERTKAELQGQAEKDRVERASHGGARADTSAASTADMAAMRERAAQYADYMKRLGEAKAAQREREAEEKSNELQSQADELERQLTDQNYNKHRDIKLNPVGTNLYIRNYSQIPSTIKPMRAEAASLSGTLVSKQTTARLQSNSKINPINHESVGPGKSVIRKTTVSGKVMSR